MVDWAVWEEYRRGPQGFYIRGCDQYGYHVRSSGNNRLLSQDVELKTLEAARNWLTDWYPGVKLYEY